MFRAPASASASETSGDDADADDGRDARARASSEALEALDDVEIQAMVTPSVYATVRALRRADGGTFHRAQSVAVDAEATARTLVRRFGGMVTFANARAGSWYAPEGAAECYFKSTDGHDKNWRFSETRLNARVAMAAAVGGGCAIVDATASATKRFPDAMSKTVPIWCETLNRAVAAAGGCAWSAEDDVGVWLPAWVSENERVAVNAMRERFDASLRRSGWDAGAELRDVLKKPFRCVWVSQGGDGDGLTAETLRNENFTPIVLVSASAPLLGRGERRVGVHGHSFAYVPGAGDDEESWARGLTPQLFRAHSAELVRASERDINALVAKIVSRAKLETKSDALGDARFGRDEEPSRSPRVVDLDDECGLGSCRVASRDVYYSTSVADVADAFLHVGETVLDESVTSSLPSFLHARARRSKVSRSDLKNALGLCVEFARRALAAKPGARLCVTCDDGVDHSVAVVVALSIALSEEDVNVTKDEIRRRLALVCRSHAEARPTRGSLKQVYAFFAEEDAEEE